MSMPMDRGAIAGAAWRVRARLIGLWLVLGVVVGPPAHADAPDAGVVARCAPAVIAVEAGARERKQRSTEQLKSLLFQAGMAQVACASSPTWRARLDRARDRIRDELDRRERRGPRGGRA